jgi:PAS domain S-box-containing protein
MIDGRVVATLQRVRGSMVGRYGMALLIAVLAIRFREALSPLVKVSEAPYLFGVTCIALSAWFGGWGAGLLTSLLITLLTELMFIVPHAGGWEDLTASRVLRDFAFLMQGVVISVVIGMLVQARREGLYRTAFQELRVEVTKAILGAGTDERAIEGALRVLAARFRAVAAVAWQSDGTRIVAVGGCVDPGAVAERLAPRDAERLLAEARAFVEQERQPNATLRPAITTAIHSLEPMIAGDRHAPARLAWTVVFPVSVPSDDGPTRITVFELRRGHPFADDPGVLGSLRAVAAEIAQCLRTRAVEGRVRDLSERLADRAQELQAVLDTAPIGIAVSFDERCRRVTVNAAGASIIGTQVTSSSDQELGSHSIEELLPSPLREPMRESMGGCRPIGPIEFVIARPDGSHRSVYQYASPLLDVHGRSRGCVAAFVDISELRAAERAVRDRELAFRRSFECAGVGKAQIDPATGRFQLVNRRLCEMLGRDADQLAGRTLAEMLDVIERERASHLLGRIIDGTDAAASAEYQFRHATGSTVFGETSITAACDASGRVTHIIAVIQDVTDRKIAERELDRYRTRLEELVAARTAALEESHTQLRLSERMAALGTLCAGLGHDMGNLLLPVRLRLEAMTIKGVPPNVEEDVRAIGKCAEYLQRLANGLRLLSLDPERPAAVETTDLTEWWSDVESFLKNCLPRGAELERKFETDLPGVSISRHRLTQAIFNLVQNAGDALKDERQQRGAEGRGTWVRIGAERGRGDATVRITVSDNGAGMAPEVRARCLEPFFTSKARGISTGLGLSLVHGIVQQSGGSIDIDSEPGRGTTFVLTLPASIRGAEHAEATELRPPVRAVVSFTDARLRTYATAVAKTLGCEVDEADGSRLTDLHLEREPRGVVWITEAKTLTASAAETFLHPTGEEALADAIAPHSRKIIAFGEVPDEPIDSPDVQWVEQPAPSVIRRSLRASVTRMAAALDPEMSSGGDDSESVRDAVVRVAP